MSTAPLIAVAGVICVAIGLRGVVMLRGVSAVERRELADALNHKPVHQGPVHQLIDLLGARFGPRLLDSMTLTRQEAIIHRIDRAGRPGGLTLERYAELRAAMLVIALVLSAFFALLGTWLMAPLLIAIGLFAVDFWLSRTGRRRQERLERDIPDFIDILAVTVRAGAGYRSALERVAHSLSGPPAEEILLTLRQMDLGASRREAFLALRQRNDSTTLTAFVTAQLQAEELGVPLADALASIAADTRRSAAQGARRRAQKVVPKVSLITAVVLLPATILLIAVGMFIGQNIQL